jgi:hypothetical protein
LIHFYKRFHQTSMGASNSNIADLSKNEALNRLVSKEVLSPSDPFWNNLLSYNFKLPVSK